MPLDFYSRILMIRLESIGIVKPFETNFFFIIVISLSVGRCFWDTIFQFFFFFSFLLF